MNRHPAHVLLLKAARALELLIAAVILLVIVCGAAELFWETGRTLLLSPGDFALGDFLSGTLLLVMGVEFVKLLALHTADAVETLLGVAAVAGIFAIKKFLQTKEEPPVK